MKTTQIKNLLYLLAILLALNTRAYAQDREKEIIKEFKRISNEGLDPDKTLGESFRQHIDNIKQYAGAKAEYRKERKYWLEIVYAENESYEAAKMIAEMSAEVQFAHNAGDLLKNNPEVIKYGDNYLSRIKKSKKPIAALVKHKRKKYSVCIVYAFEFINRI